MQIKPTYICLFLFIHGILAYPLDFELPIEMPISIVVGLAFKTIVSPVRKKPPAITVP